MADRETRYIANLIDKVSGPAKGIGRSFDLMNRKAASGRMPGALNAMTAAAGRFDSALAGLALRLGAPLAAGFGIVHMDKIARATETSLTRLGITAGVSADKLADAKRELQRIAPQLGEAQGELYRVLEVMVAGGMGWNDAVAALPQVVRTAKASGTAVEDVAKSAIAVLGNLKVPVGELEKAFDAMVTGGKLGSFELKDMAAEFPSIAAEAAKLGMTGTDAVADLAAMAQIARKTSGTSSEAANNLLEFLGKLTADTTVKNFKKFGVSIDQIFKRAKKTGGSFFDMMLDEVERLTKGDPFKIAQLFPDKQAKNFLSAIMANREEVERFRAAARDGAGAVDADFRRISATTDEAYARAGAALENLAERFGSAMTPAAKNFADEITRAAGALGEMLDEAEKRYTIFDRLSDAIERPGAPDEGKDPWWMPWRPKTGEDLFKLGAIGPIDFDKMVWGDPTTDDPSGLAARRAAKRVDDLRDKASTLRDEIAGAESAVASAAGKKAKADAQRVVADLRTQEATLKASIASAEALAGRMAARDITGFEAGQERGGGIIERRREGGTWKDRQSEIVALRDERDRLRERLTTLPRPRFEGAVDPLAGQRSTTEAALVELEGRLERAERDQRRRMGPTFGPPTAPKQMLPPERLPFALPPIRGVAPGGGTGDGFAMPRSRPAGEDRISRSLTGAAAPRPSGEDRISRFLNVAPPETSALTAAINKLAEGGEAGAEGGDAGADGGPREVTLAAPSISAMREPSGVQQVLVTNPPPAPVINTSVTVNVTTNADPQAIGNQVADELGRKIKERLEGAFVDGVM